MFIIELINCKEFADYILNYLKSRKNINKKLVTIQIGDNEASNRYIRGKCKDCEKIGIGWDWVKFEDNVLQSEVINKIIELNSDNSVSGIILQLPIPEDYEDKYIASFIDPHKDVDGFLHNSDFTPCTPTGIMLLLKEYMDIDLSGKNCVVIGRSDIVGKPMAHMLLNNNATVTVCHSKTKDIKQYTKNADIVICAVGKSKFLDSSYVNNDCVIVDVGINFDENGKICGDVDIDTFKNTNCKITPVPKGIGLLTRATLMLHSCRAFEFTYKEF